jgi:hypothetical protein
MVLAQTCGQEKDLKAATLTYTATTRGRYQKIEVKNDKATIWASHDKTVAPEVVNLSAAQQQNLVDAFNKVDLDSLPNLKAPSDKRFYDGAAIGQLTVVYKEKTYESAAFDDGNPPAAIADLVGGMTALAKE